MGNPDVGSPEDRPRPDNRVYPRCGSGKPDRGRAGARRLIVNADDFGRSTSVNEAVARAHLEGILTTASLMVNETACSAAVDLARGLPSLGVGLHLTLVCGRAATAGLAGADGTLPANAVRAGWRYFFSRGLRESLRAEILAQFDRFRDTGLVLDHVNGHLNMHLHPTVLEPTLGLAQARGAGGVRVTVDRFWLNARLARGAWVYRISHAVIFGLLARPARRGLRRHGLASTRHVFGLLQTGRITEDYLLGLLPRLPSGDSELYAHPSTGDAVRELDALVSPAVRKTVRTQRIQLIRYRELAHAQTACDPAGRARL